MRANEFLIEENVTRVSIAELKRFSGAYIINYREAKDFAVSLQQKL